MASHVPDDDLPLRMDEPPPHRQTPAGPIDELDHQYQSPGPHWINVKALCHRVVQDLQDRAARRGVVVDISVTPGEVSAIGFGPALLDAVERIAAQALYRVARGGTLQIRVDRAHGVVIECGTRLPPDQQQDGGVRHSPQLSDAAARQMADPGAWVREIVEAHRGSVLVRPQPDGGVCAVIELPAAGPGQD